MDDVSILFQDDWLIAFDKPAGLLIAPDRWDKTRENLMCWVHERLSPAIFNAHRLDRDTSGVILCAKDKDTLRKVVRLFENHDLEKEYEVLVRGTPAVRQGSIRRPIESDPRYPGRMCVAEWGRPAETRYEVVERWRGYSLLKVRPLTGRTHQIRVHLASMECPIISDVFYGDGRGLQLSRQKPWYKPAGGTETPLMPRLALHAARLSLVHPVTGQTLEILSPRPDDFQCAIRQLERYAR